MLTFSTNRGVVAASLLKVQQEVQPIVKDSTNPHFKNRYASLGAVTDTLRPILVRNGFSLLQSVEQVAGTVVVSSTLLHESGEYVVNQVAVPLGEKATPQSAGSAITYGRRYGLSALLAITTDDDDDGQRGSGQRQRALKESRVSAETNGAKAVTNGDIPFPALDGFADLRGKPIKDAPTEALEECYRRASTRAGKNARLIADAVAAELEERRTAAA